jgi:CheY-like chemotaxis protein
MPDVDGICLAREILSRQLLKLTRVIMLTSGARPDDARQLRQIGVNHHLMKPIKQSELFSAIISALGDEQPESGEETGRHQPLTRPTGLPKLKILLAEDNRVNQKLAIGILASLGHDVTVANTGCEALELLETKHFDLVLMDVQMPEMDGLAATREIRRRQIQVPVVAMTAHAMKGDREECLAAGMNDYLTKPIRMQDISLKLQDMYSAYPVAHSGDLRPDNGTRSSGSEAISWEHALRRTGGSERLLCEVVAIFIEDAPKLVAQAEQAAAEGDVEKLKHLAHSIKGSLLFLRPPAAFESAEQVELFADNGQLDQARTALVLFRKRFDQLLNMVKQHAENNQGKAQPMS